MSNYPFSWVISYLAEEYIVIAFCLRLMNKMQENLIKISACAIYRCFIKFYQFSAPPHFYCSPSSSSSFSSSVNNYRLIDPRNVMVLVVEGIQ